MAVTSAWWWLCVGQAGLAGWLLAAPSPVSRRLARLRSDGRELSDRDETGSKPTGRSGLVACSNARVTGEPGAARRAALGDLLAAVAAELRTGAPPRGVLAAAAAEAGLDDVSVAARHPAGDPVAALAAVAALPGGSVAADLAALWRVSELTGCSLVVPVTRLLAGHRADDRLHRQVDAALAGPRSTARLLALLPVAGLGLGLTLGTDPTGFLVGSPAGLGCLAGGALLVGLGVAWSRAIVRSALP